MSRLTVVAAVTGAVLVSAPAAIASSAGNDPRHVDHGSGPTYVHDPAYGDATLQVHAWSRYGETTVRLMANGLTPNRRFGAHVHARSCGADPAASGGHYQNPDVSGSLAEREVWLDLTTNRNGRGVSVTTVPWEFEPGAAGSVVVHADPTNPSNGGAGARLLCTDVSFGE